MKAKQPFLKCNLWREELLYNIDFAFYTLTRHHFAKHFHNHFVIELVVEGEDLYYCRGNNYHATKNQIVLINPGEIHTGNTIENIPLKYFSLYPDLTALQKVAEALSIHLPKDFVFKHSLSNDLHLARKFSAVFNAFLLNDDPLHTHELFLDFMNTLFSQHCIRTMETVSMDSRATMLVDYIHHHYKDEITLQNLASIVNLNPFHTVRIFKKAIGVSPYCYLVMTRAEKAKQLLRNGFKVEEAAMETGFYDSSHFYRIFRKMSGISPQSFRLCKSQYRTGLDTR